MHVISDQIQRRVRYLFHLLASHIQDVVHALGVDVYRSLDHVIQMVRRRRSEMEVLQNGLSDSFGDPRDEPHESCRWTQILMEVGHEALAVGRLRHPLKGGEEEKDLGDAIRGDLFEHVEDDVASDGMAHQIQRLLAARVIPKVRHLVGHLVFQSVPVVSAAVRRPAVSGRVTGVRHHGNVKRTLPEFEQSGGEGDVEVSHSGTARDH